MKCPKCKTSELKATKLEDGLPVNGCAECGGAIISLLYYRDWAERTANEEVGDVEPPECIAEESESKTVLGCPKCARLMTKFNISGDTQNRLDLCTGCDEAWIDGGEWELLKSLKLSKKIPSVFTDAWQRKVRKDICEQKLKQRFEKIVGNEDIEKAEGIRNWLKNHNKRAELLFYIGHE